MQSSNFHQDIILLREKNKKEMLERERAEAEANSLRRKVPKLQKQLGFKNRLSIFLTQIFRFFFLKFFLKGPTT